MLMAAEPKPRCYQCLHAVVGDGEMVRCDKGYFSDAYLKRIGYKIAVECGWTLFEDAYP